MLPNTPIETDAKRSNEMGIRSKKEERMSTADLTIKEIMGLVKYGFTAVIGSSIIFIIPYMLLLGAGSALSAAVGNEAVTNWLDYFIWAAILYFIVSNLSEFLEDLGRLFADLARVTDEMSFLRKVSLTVLFLLYLYGCRSFPNVAYFISVLVLIPGAFTYDRYKVLKGEKGISPIIIDTVA